MIGFFCGYFLLGLINLALAVVGFGFLAYITLTENWEGMAGLVLIYLITLFLALVVGQGVGYFFRNFKVSLRPKKLPKKS